MLMILKVDRDVLSDIQIANGVVTPNSEDDLVIKAPLRAFRTFPVDDWARGTFRFCQISD